MRPKRFKAYEYSLDRDGGYRLMYQGAWLASTLCWWPLAALIFWIAGVDLAQGVLNGTIYSLLSLIVLLWVLTGMRGVIEDGWELFIVPLLTFIISLVIAFVLSSRIVSGTIPVLGMMIAIVMASGIGLVVAIYIVEGLALLVTFIVPATIAMSSTLLLQVMGSGSEATALLPGVALFGSFFIAIRIGQRIAGRWIPDEGS